VKINAATEMLTQASHKLAEAMYKNAGPAQGGPQQAPPQGGEAGDKPKDNVVDAEYVDVDDNNKKQ
jgi:molecular chaperone DnaK